MTIFCSQCGMENYDTSATCSNCQAPIARISYEQPYHDQGYQDQGHQEGQRAKFSLGNILIGVVCAIYLINPTAGFIEFIPDNIPIIGNLDEAAAVTGFLMAMSNLGIIPWRKV